MKLEQSIIDELNQRLKERYGQFNDRAKFRIVWSDDQYEMRLTHFTDEGWELIHAEMRQLPKYKQYIQERYILEKLTEVPPLQAVEIGTSLSYEPLWVFRDKDNNPLPPIWPAIEFIVETVLEVGRTRGYYTPKKPTPQELSEDREQRLRKLELELFGNETEVTDALAYKEAIVVPGVGAIENE